MNIDEIFWTTVVVVRLIGLLYELCVTVYGPIRPNAETDRYVFGVRVNTI